MKKLLLTLAIVAIATTAIAQNSKSEKRRAVRQASIEAMAEQNKAALAAQTFFFTPQSYTLPYMPTVELFGSAQYYLDFYPENLDLMLPFAINGGVQRTLSLPLAAYSSYKVTPLQNGTYIVVAQLNNVSNAMFAPNMSMQNINLGIHLSVNIYTNMASLTLTPDFSAAVTYWGTVSNNM